MDFFNLLITCLLDRLMISCLFPIQFLLSLSSCLLLSQSLLYFLWIGAQFPQVKFLSYGRILTLHYYFLLMCFLFSLGFLVSHLLHLQNYFSRFSSYLPSQSLFYFLNTFYLLFLQFLYSYILGFTFQIIILLF